MKKARTLRELFAFPGFYSQRELQGIFGDQKARVVQLKRQKKEASVQDVVRVTVDTTIPKYDKYEIRMR